MQSTENARRGVLTSRHKLFEKSLISSPEIILTLFKAKASKIPVRTGGFCYYVLMITAVVAIIEYRGMVLIGKKISKPDHIFSGGWHIPGGKLEAGESPEQAVRREMLEETGLSVHVSERMAVSVQPDKEVIWFLCRVEDIDKLKPGDDLVKAKFVSKRQALEMFYERAVRMWPQRVLAYMRA